MFNNDQERRDFTERVLQQVRPVMAKRLGTTTRGYDAADEMATAIGTGIRLAAEEIEGMELRRHFTARFTNNEESTTAGTLTFEGADLDELVQRASDRGYPDMVDVRVQWRSAAILLTANELAEVTS
jgi:hypothetical protein